MYNFTELAVQLNELEVNVAPTDTRLRPDQRLMEDGKWDDANKEKLRLEEKQRTSRRKKEMEYQAQSQASLSSMPSQNDSNDDDISRNTSQSNPTVSHAPDHEAAWFKSAVDPFTKQQIHVFNNEYWECKAKQDWKRCPDIY